MHWHSRAQKMRPRLELQTQMTLKTMRKHHQQKCELSSFKSNFVNCGKAMWMPTLPTSTPPKKQILLPSRHGHHRPGYLQICASACKYHLIWTPKSCWQPSSHLESHTCGEGTAAICGPHALPSGFVRSIRFLPISGSSFQLERIIFALFVASFWATPYGSASHRGVLNIVIAELVLCLSLVCSQATVFSLNNAVGYTDSCHRADISHAITPSRDGFSDI